MDIIRARQSVLSFAGGNLVFSAPPRKMPEVPLKMQKKRKKTSKNGTKKGAVGVDKTRKPETKSLNNSLDKKRKRKRNASEHTTQLCNEHEPVVETNETKKRLRSFVKQRKKRRKKNKKKKTKTPELVAGELSKPVPPVGSGGKDDAAKDASPRNKKETVKKKRILKPKMTRITEENTPEILEMEGNLVPSDVTLEAETQHLNRQNMVTGFDGWMEAEIRQMLNSKQEAFCLETSAKVDSLREQLPRMTRAEENKWLVEVSSRARNVCEMGLTCESVCMSRAKGVNPPIRLPCVEKEGFGSYKMCLLCLRNTSTCTLLRLRMDRVSMIQDSCLQTHANYVNLNGEYRKEHTLPIRRDKYEGVVAPMVAHFHSGYNAREKVDGAAKRKRYWAQDGYTLPSVMPYDVRTNDSAQAVQQQEESGSFLLNAPQTGAMP